jgi:hypothetical protein
MPSWAIYGNERRRGVYVNEAVNLLLSPKAFDAVDWSPFAASVDDNSATDPDSTTLADFIIENTANDFHGVAQTISKDGSAIAYTLSVYAKTHPTDSRNRVALQLDDGAGNGRGCVVDLVNGEELGVAPFGYGTGFSGGAVSVVSAPNSWWLCTFSGVTTNSATSVRAVFAIDVGSTTDAAATGPYVGSGTTGILLYNASLTAD